MTIEEAKKWEEEDSKYFGPDTSLLLKEIKDRVKQRMNDTLVDGEIKPFGPAADLSLEEYIEEEISFLSNSTIFCRSNVLNILFMILERVRTTENEAYKRGYDQGQKDILEEMRLGKQRWIVNNGTECRTITEEK